MHMWLEVMKSEHQKATGNDDDIVFPRHNRVFIRSYRLAAYHQFNNWTYSFLGRGNRRVVSACEVNAVCQQFSEADNVYSGLKMAGLIFIISESGCIHMIVLI